MYNIHDIQYCRWFQLCSPGARTWTVAPGTIWGKKSTIFRYQTHVELHSVEKCRSHLVSHFQKMYCILYNIREIYIHVYIYIYVSPIITRDYWKMYERVTCVPMTKSVDLYASCRCIGNLFLGTEIERRSWCSWRSWRGNQTRPLKIPSKWRS